MKHMIKLVALAAALSAQAASAATFNLGLTADNGSRWYEYLSDAYAELGRPGKVITGGADAGEVSDGLYSISNPNVQWGTGALVFPSDGNFGQLGSLTYDDITGAITGATLDFAKYIADNDSITNSGYTTSVSVVSGSVQRNGVGGAISAINLTSNITFTYLGAYAYNGTLTFNGNSFVLAVDGTNQTFLGDARYRWDVTGGIQNLAAPVPEPSTYALMVAGLAVAGLVVRRRQSSI